MSPRRRKGAVPNYKLHKATGQAYVWLAGARTYLGKHGTPESRQRYQEVLAEWERTHAHERTAFRPSPGCTVTELAAAFLDHALTHYRRDDGSQTDEYDAFRRQLRDVLERYRDRGVDTLRQPELRCLRDAWVAKGHARPTVNQYVRRVRRVWRWGVSEQLVRPETLLALESVPDLEAGRTAAPDHGPVPPVKESVVDATLPYLGPAVAAMVRLQLLVGMRPGEVCAMRTAEVSTDGVVVLGSRRHRLTNGAWVFSPRWYKTVRKRRQRQLHYLLGPKARAVLGPWLRPDELEAPVFGSYTTDSYGRAIARAAGRAGVPHWSPGQLRHTFSTARDVAAGLEAASVSMGHARIATTELYVARDLDRAAELAERLG